MNKGDILNRADKVNFMELEEKLQRMHGFTDMGQSSNSSTYDRRYVDERTERSDVTGYGKEIAYGFDEMQGDPVHEKLVEIEEDELVNEKVNIVTVDFSRPIAEQEGKYLARKREYSVIPDAGGDNTDAYTHSGTFKASGKIIKGTASSDDNFETCNFEESK